MDLLTLCGACSPSEKGATSRHNFVTDACHRRDDAEVDVSDTRCVRLITQQKLFTYRDSRLIGEVVNQAQKQGRSDISKVVPSTAIGREV
ncbi:hypothetical protein AB0G00_31270 [Nocardia salmonicida]|uniref:hypothetical protein n=1 Tax=Nocardia TaxID=1817 RepID=UPI000C712A67|nr:hypothetical protein [Nocardia fluminea]